MNKLKLCPICNRLSRVRKQSVSVNGKLYHYLIYIHNDGSHHRTPEFSESPKISTVALVEQIIEEYLREPMKFSEIKVLVKEKTKQEIHNQIISRALRNLVRINKLNREVIGRNTIYKRNEITSIKIISEFSQIVVMRHIIKLFMVIKNVSKFIINKVGISIPFNIGTIKEINFADSIGEITDIKPLYSTSNETLYELTLNRFVKQSEHEIVTFEIKLIDDPSGFILRVPFDINQLQINIYGNKKIIAKSFEKDLLHFSPPMIIRRDMNDKIGEYTTIIFGSLMENATVSIDISDS